MKNPPEPGDITDHLVGADSAITDQAVSGFFFEANANRRIGLQREGSGASSVIFTSKVDATDQAVGG